MKTMVEKPLFIPLKTPYFEAFLRGTKNTEYRLYGPRWNERTCRIGRRVVLSLGYGKKARLAGVVSDFWKDTSRTDDFKACYPGKAGAMACIQIKLLKRSDATSRP